MSRNPASDVEHRVRDGEAIDRAILAAHRRVILRHRQAKVPLAIWSDGQVLEIDPELVDLPPTDDPIASREGKR